MKNIFKNRFAQISMEFVILLSFILVLTAPLIIFYQSYSNKTRFELTEAQARSIALKIVDSAESVYYFGEPSQTILKVNIPENLDSITITNDEIIFKVSYGGEITDIAVPSNVNITGFVRHAPGQRNILIKAINGSVNISDY